MPLSLDAATGAISGTPAGIGSTPITVTVADANSLTAPQPLTLVADPAASLDAIHLASARLLGSDLRVVVTYDERMVAAGSGLGMPWRCRA